MRRTSIPVFLLPNSGEARKLEAIASLHGIEDGDTAQEQSAVAVAKAFRDNKSNSASDRLDVALALERVNMSNAGKAKKIVPRTSDWEQMANSLRTEFGDQPQLHDYYAQLVREGDMFSSKRIATNLLSWKPAPAAKAEAQAALDRHSLIGKPLALVATDSDGKPLDFSKQAGAITVIHVRSSSADPDVLNQLKRFRSAVPPGANVVYLMIGGDAARLAAAAPSQPIRGRSCFVPVSASKAVVDYLKLRDTPYLYVLDRKGNVVGFGPPGEFMGVMLLAIR